MAAESPSSTGNILRICVLKQCLQLRCSTAQYSVIQCSVIQCSIIQYSSVVQENSPLQHSFIKPKYPVNTKQGWKPGTMTVTERENVDIVTAEHCAGSDLTFSLRICEPMRHCYDCICNTHIAVSIHCYLLCLH